MPESAGNDAPLGIFGGTFDPVHFGHLRLAGEAIAQLGLSGVRWIPAGQPRHREPPRVAAVDRLQMVRLALAGDPRFSVDAAEVESGEASYTVPTLERLRAEFGPRRSLVLLGADAYAGLPTWHRWRELFSLAHIAVTLRPAMHSPGSRRRWRQNKGTGCCRRPPCCCRRRPAASSPSR